MALRLDQFIANSSGLSRKEAKHAIAGGRVRVGSDVCKGAGTKVAPDASVCLDDQPLSLPGERYLMLHKPAGVVSATRDSDHPTALDLLPSALVRNLHIAGRLDIDTTGLLLLSTDGQWSHRITSPRVDCPKTYRVTLAEPLTDQAARDLESGVQLRQDPTPTRPAGVHRVAERVIELTLSEGRYHQVKRMLAALGNHVEALHRERIGNIRLDPTLAPGAWRPLSRQEIDSVW